MLASRFARSVRVECGAAFVDLEHDHLSLVLKHNVLHIAQCLKHYRFASARRLESDLLKLRDHSQADLRVGSSAACPFLVNLGKMLTELA